MRIDACKTHHLCLAAAWLAIAVSIAGGAETPQTAPPSLTEITRKLESGQPLVFATFGDSITWPCFHTDFRQNYVTLAVDALRQAYPQATVKIVHVGNMGTAARGLDAFRFEKHVLEHRPDLVFLMFGMNDCSAGQPGLDAFDRQLSELMRKTRENGALPVVLTQNEILYDSEDGRRRTSLPLYRRRALDVARREECPSVDCFAAWEAIARDRAALVARLNDWIHPNLAGHRLFAKSIVETLWPAAARFVVADVRSPQPGSGDAVDCLVPGPAGKQIIQTANGATIALSCRKRRDRITDLVFSFSKKRPTTWSDFQHVTLVGPEQEALFDAQDRTITAGLLLEQKGTVSVVFSWNVGTFYVTLDTNRADWTDRVADPSFWLSHTTEPFVRPTSVASSTRDGALLHDAFLQTDGRPAVVCSDFKLAPGAGYEIVEGEEGIALVTGQRETQTRFPLFHAVRCLQGADARLHFLAQQKPGGPWRVGVLGSTRIEVSQQTGAQCLLPASGSGFRAVVQSDAGNSQWTLLTADPHGALAATMLTPLADSGEGRMIPLPWTDGARDGIHWLKIPRPETHFAFQSRLPAGTMEIGLLVEQRGHLEYSVQDVTP